MTYYTPLPIGRRIKIESASNSSSWIFASKAFSLAPTELVSQDFKTTAIGVDNTLVIEPNGVARICSQYLARDRFKLHALLELAEGAAVFVDRIESHF